ncbi:uncharacterized protein LOC141850923 [Brevipalpus obovatus]|uniref:uncharacterized protein LOC141850923 n=1 Tax=Brevipalpus obovatus TaxID=246614 RepID=UPI003D9F40E7
MDTRRKCDIGPDETNQLDRMAGVEYGKLIGFTSDQAFVRLFGQKGTIKLSQRIVYKYKEGQTHLTADQEKFKLAEEYAAKMKGKPGHNYEKGHTLVSRKDGKGGITKGRSGFTSRTTQKNDENDELNKLKAKLMDMVDKGDPALRPLLNEIMNALDYASLPGEDSQKDEGEESDAAWALFEPDSP